MTQKQDYCQEKDLIRYCSDTLPYSRGRYAPLRWFVGRHKNTREKDAFWGRQDGGTFKNSAEESSVRPNKVTINEAELFSNTIKTSRYWSGRYEEGTAEDRPSVRDDGLVQTEPTEPELESESADTDNGPDGPSSQPTVRSVALIMAGVSPAAWSGSGSAIRVFILS